MHRTMKYISIVAIFLMLTTVAFGQEQFGSIEISTKDSAGALVPGVSATIVSIQGTAGFRRTVTTDSSGFIRIPQVPPGVYQVTTAAIQGFAETKQNLQVELGKATQVGITMGTTASAEVEVIGGDVPLDSTSSEISTAITTAKIEALPKGVSFTSILKTVPGTRPEGLAGGISIDGASGAENTFILDGLEITNYRNAGLNASNDVPFSIVNEMQVKSSGFNAEYGGATGGVINVVTKGGNNEFHGDFGFQLEPSKLQGGNTPSLLTFNNNQDTEYFSAPKSKYINFFPSMSVSGPIVKNKVYFFGNYSPQVFESTVDTVFYNNSPSATRVINNRETYRRTRTYEYAFGRIDATPFEKLRLTGTYLWNPLIDEGALPFGTASFGGSIVPVNFGGDIGSLQGAELARRQGGRQNSNQVTFQAVYTPTSNVVTSFRYGRGFLNEKLGNYFVPTGTRYICDFGNTVSLNYGANACNTGLVDPANDATVKDVSVRENFEGDVSFLFSAGGRHELKGGYGHSTIANDLQKADTTRVYLQYGRAIDNHSRWANGAIPSAPLCVQGQPQVNCVLGVGALYRYAEAGQGSNRNQSVYIQDKWQPHSRLTLNLGLRIEKEDLPTFNQYDTVFEFNWKDKIAPRIGGAFDLFGNGKDKIFASYGDFYDRLKFKLAQGSFGGNFYRVDFFEMLPTDGPFRAAYTRGSILGNYADPIGGSCPATGFIGSGLSRCQNDYRVASNVPGANIEESGAIDPDTKPYKQREFTIGYERELSRDYVFSFRYTNKKLLETIEDAGAISAEGSEVYVTGNPGKGLHAQFLSDFGYAAPYASAERKYQVLEFVLERRFADNYFFNANYSYSRLRGNYSGLANSDEAGRSDPGVNRSFDLPMIGFTARGGSDSGALATDRPHVFNVFGGYSMNWGSTGNSTEFSAFQTFQSGTPQSTTIDFIVPIFLNGRGDRGRTPMYSQTDFSITHKYKFGRDGKFSVAANVNFINLFNQDTVTGYYNDLTNFALLSNTNTVNAFGCPLVDGGIDYPCVLNKFNSGALSGAIDTLVAAGSKDGRFGQSNAFQSPRNIRFGFRFTF